MFRKYYYMTKPGIVRGNLITVIGAFLFASNGDVNTPLFISTLLGISFVIASACVFNNYIDRGVDQLMDRTKKRALVTNGLRPEAALVFATTLGLAGLAILGLFVNILTMLMGAAAFLIYVVLYGVTKRRTEHGTLVGSFSGAMPITAGYTAVTGKFDGVALILFLILVFWQMPHFYAIAIYRLKDYKAAKLPMLPITRGVKNTQTQIVVYILLFFLATTSLYIRGSTGITYQVLMTIVTSIWFGLAINVFSKDNPYKSDMVWAKKMFRYSLIVLLSLSILLALNNFLP